MEVKKKVVGSRLVKHFAGVETIFDLMDMEDEDRNKLLGMSEQKLASLAVNTLFITLSVRAGLNLLQVQCILCYDTLCRYVWN